MSGSIKRYFVSVIEISGISRMSQIASVRADVEVNVVDASNEA